MTNSRRCSDFSLGASEVDEKGFLQNGNISAQLEMAKNQREPRARCQASDVDYY